MQDRAMALMGRKLTAAQALEGKFSSEGLVAMAGEDANVELARSLVERMDEGDARRIWSKTALPTEAHINTEPCSITLPLSRDPAPVHLGSRKRRSRAVCMTGATLF